MSDEPPQSSDAGQSGDQPRKRRRRRRRNKNKSGQGKGPQASNHESNLTDTNAASADSSEAKPKAGDNHSNNSPDQGERSDHSGQGGYRGKGQNQKSGQGSRSGRSRRDGVDRGGSSGGRGSHANPKDNAGQAPHRPGNSAGKGKGKTKKRRKPRTKQCVNCYTPCTTIHRVRLDYRKQWVFICDICWPTRCVDNPHYEFGGTWVSGRIVKPESQLRDEWLAKQKQNKSNHKPREDRPHDHDKPQAFDTKSQPNDTAAGDTPKPVEAKSPPAAQGDESDQHAAADPPPEQGQGS